MSIAYVHGLLRHIGGSAVFKIKQTGGEGKSLRQRTSIGKGNFEILCRFLYTFGMFHRRLQAQACLHLLGGIGELVIRATSRGFA